MASDGVIRASDSDRERVVTMLRDGFAAGRLTLAEFDQRSTAAFAARTWGELRELVSDLPGEPGLGADLPAARRHAVSGVAGGAGPVSGRAGWSGQGSGPDGMARLIPALPIALVWLAISLTAHSPIAFIPILLLVLAGLRFAGGTRNHPGGPGRR
jgi:hypothetical protein